MDLSNIPPNTLFYDGVCGLCHHTVKFVLKHDKAEVFTFAPLQGELFGNAFSEDEKSNFPDSIVLVTENKTILTRSSATAYLLQKIGGFWGVLGKILSIIPCFLRDTGYIFVASVRHKIFSTPEEVCPMLPDELKKRFL